MSDNYIIKQLPAFTLIGFGAGLSLLDAELFKKIGVLWDQLIDYKNKNEIISSNFSNVTFGFEEFTSNTVVEKEFFYMASVAVDELVNLPEGITSKQIPSSSYVVFTHHGPISKIGETFRHLHSNVLPNLDFKFKRTYDFEYYDERFKYINEDSEVDIYFPIE